MSRKINYSSLRCELERCWVGEKQKVCYATREEAEVAAKVAAYDHGVPELSVYKCEYGPHWHLSSKLVG